MSALGEYVELRAIWEEREGLRHAVSVVGYLTSETSLTADEIPTTDCGVRLPQSAALVEDPLTCEACLWGWLDPALKASTREPITA